MKLNILKASTSVICHIFVQNSASTTGAGLTGLTNASAGLNISYMRAGAAAAVTTTVSAITTLGTFAGSATASAFKEVDAVNLPGVYELQLPNNALATGVNQVIVMASGATGMAPVVLEAQLVSLDPNSAGVASVSGAVGSVTGAVGSVTAAVTLSGDLSATMKTSVQTAVASELDVAGTELASVPGSAATLRQTLRYLLQYFRNKRTVTATTQTLFKEDSTTSLGTTTVSDDGTTFTTTKAL